MSLCPKCGRSMFGVQYHWNHPDHHDGISEWWCHDCDVRYGRWSGKVLGKDDSEKVYGGDDDK